MEIHPVILLILGLILLLTGGEFLVRGGVSLASHFRISTLVVGVTVVSLGTSAPELVVSVNAALSGHPDISMGNVIGSNIANIGLVLGLTIIIMPVFINSKTLLFNGLVMIGSTLLLILFISDRNLSRAEGLILFALLVAFVWYSIQRSRKNLLNGIGEVPDRKYSLVVSLLIVFVAGFALVFGARFLVGGASEIARNIGVSERAISVSVIALGTSLPELATSAIAAFRKESDISIGNIIGSNIFNILGILGVTASIKSISVSPRILDFDVLWCMAISLFLFVIMLPLREVKLGRIKGGALVLIYISYIYLVFYSDVV
ncbi:MAG: calcium/sodium antiporter [Bacteroidales bacterium]